MNLIDNLKNANAAQPRLLNICWRKRSRKHCPAHYRELLSTLLWKITEAESHKYKTRFQTQGAMGCSDKAKLMHEHVFQRSKMIAALEKAEPHEVDDTLKDAIGCTLTVEEHSPLFEFDEEYGWERYRKAGVAVVDTQTDERVI